MEKIFRFIIWLADIIFRKEKVNSEKSSAVSTRKPRLDIAVKKNESRHWKGIIWHHSLSSDRAARDWGGIVKYHTSYRVDFTIVSQEEFERRLKNNEGKHFERPWRDIGYHGGTELVDGKPVFHWGRPLGMKGAHAGVSGVSNEFNKDYLGLCCIGNFDLISPSPELWDFNLKLTRALMNVFQIPKEEVIGHREVYDRLVIPRQKACPGKNWNTDLFRAEL